MLEGWLWPAQLEELLGLARLSGRLEQFPGSAAEIVDVDAALLGLLGDPLSEVQRLSGTDPNFWHVIDFRDINIQVRGDVAAVTYVITYNGRVVERATPQAPDLYARATRTVVGPKPNLQTALANLARAASPGPNQAITQKEYEAQKARLLKFGAKPPVIYKKGQWYDDLDSHIHCGP